MLWSTGHPLTSITWPYRGLKCRFIEVEYFFEVIRWQITSFKWSLSNMLCLCHSGPALLGFWFQTDLESKNSASFFKSKGREGLFLPWSRLGHALRSIFILWLVKIWQVSSCGKIMQHVESCLLLTAEADRVLCQLVMFLTVFFHWMYKTKYSCCQESSVIHGWFVYWVFECVYLSANRFSMAWEKGIQLPYPFFVFAWHWKSDLNFAFFFVFV